jgi:hypothetical protein
MMYFDPMISYRCEYFQVFFMLWTIVLPPSRKISLPTSTPI